MNKIKTYYWYVGIPIAAVVLGTILFFDLIERTVQGNPHPQINYLIFVLIVASCYLMWAQVARMNRDARFIENYYHAAITRTSVDGLRSALAEKQSDTKPVLDIVTDLMGKSVSQTQHSALESELERYKSLQARYLILPQFLGGMMVGLGLLGTFVGLLGALAEISNLIGAFSVTTSGDPVESIRMLVERLTAPMQAMGVAFSASLFGVMGSLIVGVLLVGVRNCTGELNALLETRVTYLTDFSNPGPDTDDMNALSDAVSLLAEQSPVLRGLAVAMEQSERRVRDLINTVVHISSRLELNQASNMALTESMTKRLSTEDAIHQSMQVTQDTLAQIATRWSNAAQIETQVAEVMEDQRAQNERFLENLERASQQHQHLVERLVQGLAAAQIEQATSVQQLTLLNDVLRTSGDETIAKLSDIAGAQRRGSDQIYELLQSGFNDIAGVQRRGSDQVLELLQSGFKDMAGVNRRSSDEHLEVTQAGFRDLAGAQRRASDETNKEQAALMGRLNETIVSGQREQVGLRLEIARIPDVLLTMPDSNQSSLQKVVDVFQRHQEKAARDQAETSKQLQTTLEHGQQAQVASIKGVENTVKYLASAIQGDCEARVQMMNRVELLLQSHSERQEQISSTLLQIVSPANSSAD